MKNLSAAAARAAVAEAGAAGDGAVKSLPRTTLAKTKPMAGRIAKKSVAEAVGAGDAAVADANRVKNVLMATGGATATAAATVAGTAIGMTVMSPSSAWVITCRPF
jgi:hypothetical protein